MAAADAPGAAPLPAPAEQIGLNKQFGGTNRRYRHASAVLGCSMSFTVFFPPGVQPDQGSGEGGARAPVLLYLSGLTCSDENFIQKAGAQRRAAALGLALVAPDTSPRGLGVEGESESWDFGVGAGFYLNATQPKWAAWRMEDYVTKELPALLDAQFGSVLDLGRVSVAGHSMGGHGALTLALRHPAAYRSVSAFSPICNPTQVPWGVKAFTGYLGEDRSLWEAHDASLLLAGYSGPRVPVLVDTGSADSFLQTQLRPEALQAAADKAGYPITMRMQDGYDHSYFFVSTFIDDHLEFHAKALLAP